MARDGPIQHYPARRMYVSPSYLFSGYVVVRTSNVEKRGGGEGVQPSPVRPCWRLVLVICFIHNVCTIITFKRAKYVVQGTWRLETLFKDLEEEVDNIVLHQRIISQRVLDQLYLWYLLTV